jgi:tetratricopeptide (TPR) repeat protein
VIISPQRTLRVRSKFRNVLCKTVLVYALAILACSSPTAAADDNSQNVAQAATLIHSGKLDAAEDLLWKVLTQHPDDPEALNLLGSIRLQQKRLAESETLLHRSITLAPDRLPAHINLARVFHAEDETDKEIIALQDAVRLAPNNADIDCSLAAAYLKKNDFHDALEALDRIPHAHRPDSALPLLAASYLGLNRVTEAQALAPEVTARAAKNSALRVEFAKVLLDFDFTDDALALLEIAEKQQRPTSELFFMLGRARERKGQLALAQKDFQRAIDLNPTSVNALQALARILATQEQWGKSLELLSRARTVSPDSPDVLRKFAAASLRAGRTSDAVGAAQQLVKLRPDESEALYLLGVAQLQNGDTDAARTTIENYTKLRPQDPLAFLALGMVASTLHDFPVARTNFEQSIQLDPNHLEAYYQLALIFRDQGDNRAAISQLEKAAAIDSKHVPTQALLGTLYLLQQDYVKAQEHLTRAEELAPNTPDTHYQLGLLFARLNQPEHAQREMDQFRKLKDQGHSIPTPPGDRPPTTAPPNPPS